MTVDLRFLLEGLGLIFAVSWLGQVAGELHATYTAKRGER